MSACYNGHNEIASLLADRVNDLNVGDSVLCHLSHPSDLPKEGATALMLACSRGFLEIAALLIGRGANVNSQNLVTPTLLPSLLLMSPLPEGLHGSDVHQRFPRDRLSPHPERR
jgi:ankyrin repeat protein